MHITSELPQGFQDLMDDPERLREEWKQQLDTIQFK